MKWLIRNPMLLFAAAAAFLATQLRAEEIPIETGWKEQDLTIGHPWGPGIFAVESEAVTIETTGEVPENHTGISDALALEWIESTTDLSYSDGFVQTLVRPNAEGVSAWLALRNTPSSGPYFFTLSEPSDEIRITRWDGVGVRLIDTPFPVDPGDEVFIKAGAVGGHLSMKVWRTSDTEPALPQISIVDEVYSRGSFGIGISKDDGFEPAAKIIATFSEVMFFPPLVGDYNANGSLDVGDIDTLTDLEDRRMWVKDLKHTWFGDANLDGEFKSGDLVEVFEAGKYEQDVVASWSEGDWNGDGSFGTGDLVTAFEDGGYEQGPQPVAAVPEPASIAMLMAGLIGLASVSNTRRKGC